MTTYGIMDFLEDIRDNKIDPVESAYDALCAVDLPRLERAWKRLQQVRATKISGTGKKARALKGRVSRHVGLLFERVVRVLLDNCVALSHGGNVRSGVAEIDFLIRYNPIAAAVPMFRDAGTHSLGEAKCVSGPLKTHWVTELAGLMPLHGTNLAILFTAAPSRKLGSECRQAIALQSALGMRIVPFGVMQFERVLAGENFLKVISDQYVKVAAMSTDLSI